MAPYARASSWSPILSIAPPIRRSTTARSSCHAKQHKDHASRAATLRTTYDSAGLPWNAVITSSPEMPSSLSKVVTCGAVTPKSRSRALYLSRSAATRVNGPATRTRSSPFQTAKRGCSHCGTFSNVLCTFDGEAPCEANIDLAPVGKQPRGSRVPAVTAGTVPWQGCVSSCG